MLNFSEKLWSKYTRMDRQCRLSMHQRFKRCDARTEYFVKHLPVRSELYAKRTSLPHTCFTLLRRTSAAVTLCPRHRSFKKIIFWMVGASDLNCRSGNGDMWMLLQGAFADDWIQSKAAKGKAADEKHVLSNGTKASAGHASGAAGTMKALRERNASADNLYKMPRFQKVPCKVHIPRGHSAAGHS